MVWAAKPPKRSGINVFGREFSSHDEVRDFLRLSQAVISQTTDIPDTLVGKHVVVPKGAKSPADAFSRALTAQRSEMKGITRVAWLVYGITLCATGIYYSGGAAAMFALTPGANWAVAVLLPIMTLGISAAHLRHESQQRTYDRIEDMYQRLGYDRFMARLAQINKCMRHLQGKGLTDLLTTLPTITESTRRTGIAPEFIGRVGHIFPQTEQDNARWVIAIGRELDTASKQRAALTGENPAAVFQSLTTGHRRTILTLGSLGLTGLGGAGVALALSGGAPAIAAGLGLGALGLKVGHRTRQLYRLFSRLAQQHQATGPDAYPAFLEQAEANLPKTSARGVRHES